MKVPETERKGCAGASKSVRRLPEGENEGGKHRGYHGVQHHWSLQHRGPSMRRWSAVLEDAGEGEEGVGAVDGWMVIQGSKRYRKINEQLSDRDVPSANIPGAANQTLNSRN